MTNDKRNQSPEELGEAVGKKIEELFGGMFADDIPSEKQAPQAAPPSAPKTPARESAPAQTQSPMEEEAFKTKIEPIEQSPEQELVDQIDARVLQLEWEISDETVKDLLGLFKEMESSLAEDQLAKTLVTMDMRVVQRIGSAGETPMPQCVKFLQDSVEALRYITGSNNSIESPQKVLNELKNQYQSIMAATPDPTTAKPADQAHQMPALLENLGASTRSLHEISQRLSRILAVFRQGGDMSGEEITRRLGALDKILAENVNSISSIHKSLKSIEYPASSGSKSFDEPDGVLMIACGSSALAIPSSLVKALYPITPEQAKPLIGKSSVTLGAGPVPRLPIKIPQASQAKAPPSLLVHLSLSNREFFILADKGLGYRTAPAGVDLMKQTRVKIGVTNYAILNPVAMKLG